MRHGSFAHSYKITLDSFTPEESPLIACLALPFERLARGGARLEPVFGFALFKSLCSEYLVMRPLMSVLLDEVRC